MVNRLRSIAVVLGVVCTTLFLPMFVVAVTTDQVGLGYGAATGLGGQDIRIVAARLIQALLGVMGIVLLILIIYAGVLWMTAGGESDKIERAKAIIRSALVGLLVILSSYSIVLYLFCNVLSVVCPDGFGFQIAGPSDNTNPSLTGTFGRSIVDYYYPTGRETGESIPGRDTVIWITFAEKIDISSLGTGQETINLSNGTTQTVYFADATPTDQSAFRLMRGLRGQENPQYVPVSIRTIDDKTFEFRVRPSGVFPAFANTADATENYTVILRSNLKKADGTPAFSALAGDEAFTWNFSIANRLDVVPPYVTNDVFPSPDSVDRVAPNAVVQLNFSEPVSPLQMRPENLHVTASFRQPNGSSVSNADVAGTWYVSNGYKTLEFLPADSCTNDSGAPMINSCGQEIFCLPKDADILVRVDTASLKSEADRQESGKQFFAADPVDGVVDAASNALDGDRDNTPDGKPVATTPTQPDSYTLTFKTSSELDLTPPRLEYLTPSSSDAGTLSDPLSPVAGQFSKVMQSRTFNQSTVKFDAYQWNPNTQTSAGPSQSGQVFYWFSLDRMNTTLIDEADDLSPNASVTASIFSGAAPSSIRSISYLNHLPLIPGTQYQVTYTSEVKDAYQNCFNVAQCEGASCVMESSNGTCTDLGNGRTSCVASDQLTPSVLELLR